MVSIINKHYNNYHNSTVCSYLILSLVLAGIIILIGPAIEIFFPFAINLSTYFLIISIVKSIGDNILYSIAPNFGGAKFWFLVIEVPTGILLFDHTMLTKYLLALDSISANYFYI